MNEKQTLIPGMRKLLLRGEVDKFPINDIKVSLNSTNAGLTFNRFVVESISPIGIPPESTLKIGDSVVVEKHVLMASMTDTNIVYNASMVECPYNSRCYRKVKEEIDALDKFEYQKLLKDLPTVQIMEHVIVDYHDVRAIFTTYSEHKDSVPFANAKK